MDENENLPDDSPDAHVYDTLDCFTSVERATSITSTLCRGESSRQGQTALEIIHFNVGGKVFTTTKSTLFTLCEKGNFFHLLLNSSVPLLYDNNGCIFIDRDPQCFAAILGYARGGALALKDFHYLKDDMLHAEFDYYMLTLPRLLAGALVTGFYVKDDDPYTVLWVDEDPNLSHEMRYLSGVMYGCTFSRVEIRVPCVAMTVRFSLTPERTVEIFLRNGSVYCREVGIFQSLCKVTCKWNPSKELSLMTLDGGWTAHPTRDKVHRFCRLDLVHAKRLSFSYRCENFMLDATLICNEMCPFFFTLELAGEHGVTKSGVDPSMSALVIKALMPKCMLLKAKSLSLFEKDAWVSYHRHSASTLGPGAVGIL